MEWLKDYPIFSFLFGCLFTIGISWKQIKELLSTYKEQVSTLRSERDDYKKNLHTARNELQECHNRIAEYELQPDLGTIKTLIEGQTAAMTGIGQTGSVVAEALKSHMVDDHKAFEHIGENLSSISKSLTNLFKMLQSHDPRVAAHVRKAKGQ